MSDVAREIGAALERAERLLWERTTDNRILLANIQGLSEENARLRAEVADWHACVRSEDMLVSNEKFIMWDREALDRCRERYIENVASV